MLTDDFVTQSGRQVALELYVDKGQAHLGTHALASLKKAMRWDETKYGLEYDLDTYMVVAVDFFNMGAMENKGLNIFNSKYVLADENTATDQDYFDIESVIAHEYFHNWTGNRITCRDWFQLSLKEGLTVFRDQQFSADTSSPLITRINQVKVMREHQFAEDAGPTAHPIRPNEVMEINNFYTVTVYEKGAEVIRMLHTLLGEEGFKKGMDTYVSRHDGQAVTCEDFIRAMEEATSVDLSQFRLWYSQSGTPVVDMTESYSAKEQRFQLHFRQHIPESADQANTLPLILPVKIELLSQDQDHQQNLIVLKQSEETCVFENCRQKPISVLFSDFSAPVRIKSNQPFDEKLQVVIAAQDAFSRWDACQTLYTALISARYTQEQRDDNEAKLFECLAQVLVSSDNAIELKAELLKPPSFETLMQHFRVVDVEQLCSSLKEFNLTLANTLREALWDTYQSERPASYQYEQGQVNRRNLRNACLQLLVLTEDGSKIAQQHYAESDNMTDTMASLKALGIADLASFDHLMSDFESKWQHSPLVMDKWFGLQATSEREDSAQHVESLFKHEHFSLHNPNRVRALLGSFCFRNPLGFHCIDGSGYRLLTTCLLELDAINPQVASRLITPLLSWSRLDPIRQNLIKDCLTKLSDKAELSRDLGEKITKSLATDLNDIDRR
jgi:aminopeptidase N